MSISIRSLVEVKTWANKTYQDVQNLLALLQLLGQFDTFVKLGQVTRDRDTLPWSSLGQAGCGLGARLSITRGDVHLAYQHIAMQADLDMRRGQQDVPLPRSRRILKRSTVSATGRECKGAADIPSLQHPGLRQ
jgi:hypothetical protein